MNEAYVSLKRLAELFGVKPGTVRNWRYRGWIDVEGKRRHIRVKDRLYNALDVRDAERDTRCKPQHSHRKPIAA